jgi:cysteine desulfurase
LNVDKVAVMERIYLDNNATTRVFPEVADAMMPYFTQFYGNASSLHSFGREARKAVDEARDKVASLIGASVEEIVFTGSGTESNNQAIRGILEANRKRGNHVISSTIEHPAVLEVCNYVEKEGAKVTRIKVNSNGIVRLEDIEKSFTDKTVLVSIMLANNEVGTVQPIAEIVKLAKKRGVIVHTDAVQGVGKIPVSVAELGVDALSMSAHKFHGPKGVGALYVRKGVKIAPLLYGGGHERGRRPGTENVPGIVGMGKACEIARRELTDYGRRVNALRNCLEQKILEKVQFTYVNGDRERRLPNTTNISFEYIEGEGIVLSLDLKGIAVSTGSACATGKLEPSHVLIEMGLSPALAQGAIRFSLGSEITQEQIDYTAQTIVEVVERLRKMSPLYEDALKQGIYKK